MDLRVSIGRQTDPLRKELASITGQVAVLQEEIKRCELISDMLYGGRDGKRSGRSRSTVGARKRMPRNPMIDSNAVFATLPGEFTLDTLSAHETTSGKPRAHLRQLDVRWSKGGRIKRTGRGLYQKPKLKGNRTHARGSIRFLYSNRLRFAYGDSSG